MKTIVHIEDLAITLNLVSFEDFEDFEDLRIQGNTRDIVLQESVQTLVSRTLSSS
jgi:hypothetical protein